MSVNIDQIKTLARNMKSLGADMRKVNAKLNSVLPPKLLKMLEKGTPKDTGKTSKEWTVKRNGSNGFQITNKNGNILTFLIEGTKPHIIEPVNKSALFFQMNGSKIFAKFVEHPGTPSQMNYKSLFGKMMKVVDKETDLIITSMLKKKIK